MVFNLLRSFISFLRATGCDGFPMLKGSAEDDNFLLNTTVYDLGKGIKI